MVGDMAATYPGGARIEQAQAVLDRHAVSSADGLCMQCKIPWPCREYEAAARVFALSARLPQRRPGATRPDLMGVRREGFNWFAARAG
jgi:hypothetical protein